MNNCQIKQSDTNQGDRFNDCLAGWQLVPVFIFANQAGLDMLETTLVALQDVSLDKIFDEAGRKALCNVVPQVMQQVIFVGKLFLTLVR